jgi:flagellar P-ring protein precursor FlgI
VKQGVQTSGRVPGGATVERELPNSLDNMTTVRLALHTPDFTTAARIEQAINSRMGGGIANAVDLGTVDVRVPISYQRRVTEMLAQIERIEVHPDTPAKVVIDEKSGTIVVGAEVKLDSVAVAHGNLTVRVTETAQVSQPRPFSRGRTAVTPKTDIDVNDHADRNLQIMPRAATLKDLVAGLNALGLGPRDLIQVLNALKAAGALHAELDFI